MININTINSILIFGQNNVLSDLVCEKPGIKSISASGALKSHPPKNAIDGNQNTRWSVSGIDSWVQVDFGEKRNICEIDISWYKGDQRIYSFVVEVSNDGKNFKEIQSIRSSGTTNDFENYELKDSEIRYLKIIVTKNTENNLASINDIAFNMNKEPDQNLSDPKTEPESPLIPTKGYGDNIAVAADWSCGTPAKKTIKNVIAMEPSLLVVAGDMSYDNTGDCWLDIISPINDLVRITLGNHDVDEGNPESLAKQYIDHFKLPSTYYSFDYKNIHFLMLNSETDFDVDSKQYNFVLNDLKRTESDPNIEWIITVFHHPIYTTATKHSPNEKFRDIYHPIFDQYDVDFVIQGHVHNYQRTYPIVFNEHSPDTPIVTNQHKNTYVDPTGQIYLITGTAGRQNHELIGQANYNADQYKGFGFLNLMLSNDGKTIKGVFYSNNNGEIIDEFVVQKTGAIKPINPDRNYKDDKKDQDNLQSNPLDSLFSDILNSTPRYK